jgi:hypothetical protein
MNRLGLNGEKMLPLLAHKKVGFPIFVASGTATEKDVRKCAGSELSVSFMKKPFDVEVFTKYLVATLKAHH